MQGENKENKKKVKSQGASSVDEFLAPKLILRSQGHDHLWVH